MPTFWQSWLNVSVQLLPASPFFWRSVSGSICQRVVDYSAWPVVYVQWNFKTKYIQWFFFLLWHMILFSKAPICLLWEEASHTLLCFQKEQLKCRESWWLSTRSQEMFAWFVIKCQFIEVKSKVQEGVGFDEFI